MRSVILFFVEPDRKQIEASLSQCGAMKLDQSDSPRWAYPSASSAVAWIEWYSQFEELDNAEWRNLERAIGDAPGTALVIDISGRIHGYRELQPLLSGLLTRHQGAAMDDYGSEAWTIEAIERSQDGSRRFLHPRADWE